MESLTILVAPIEGVGHFNACIGISQQLLLRGHKVVFATPNSWKGKLTPMGFIEEYYQEDLGLKEDESTEKWGEIIAAMAPALAFPPILKMETIHFSMFQEAVSKTIAAEKNMNQLMDRVQPDLVIVDDLFAHPSLTCKGVPWILSASIQPIGISSKNVPPPLTGYPCMDGDKNLWREYNNKYESIFGKLYEEFKAWVIENGGPELKYMGLPYWLEYSPYANVYMYPQELDYTHFRPNPPNWYRFDSFVRTDATKFDIPKELEGLPGKLIYVSMGTIGCSELGLMKTLVSFLTHSPHRFILSTGPFGNQLTLAANMWGASYVPQTKVIPLVDLVVTHGGNNTFTESFYFGKRMIVLPLFGDQLDNAQRIEETGLGIQFHPYHVTQDQLLDGIERMLGDELLEKRMKAISKRMQASKSQERVAELVERVAYKNSPKFLPSDQRRPSTAFLQVPSSDSRRSSIEIFLESQENPSIPPLLSLWARRRSAV